MHPPLLSANQEPHSFCYISTRLFIKAKTTKSSHTQTLRTFREIIFILSTREAFKDVLLILIPRPINVTSEVNLTYTTMSILQIGNTLWKADVFPLQSEQAHGSQNLFQWVTFSQTSHSFVVLGNEGKTLMTPGRLLSLPPTPREQSRETKLTHELHTDRKSSSLEANSNLFTCVTAVFQALPSA